jgi:D-beta-D-heptose 7-phosphate kinase/D-beta-D-heptose 1-phosphate adenosyltransferase
MMISLKKTVLVNGCFDLLHVGHIALLKTAHALARGGFVVVAVDTDERVKNAKGANRPINTLDQRMEMLKSIRYVSHVVCFSSIEELQSIAERYCVDYLVKGIEYASKDIPEKHWGIPLVYHTSLETRTSDIIKEIHETF